jgi:hypothetical protein
MNNKRKMKKIIIIIEGLKIKQIKYTHRYSQAGNHQGFEEA